MYQLKRALRNRGLKFFLLLFIVSQMGITFNIPTLNVPSVEASFSVSIAGVTATQAIFAYTAPDNSPCTIEVSESSSYTPLVHDVDSTLFSGANLDTRSGALGAGTTNRIVVIGKRAAEQALDSKYYSRALQTNTTHYYRVSCGSSVATGNFTTKNIPLGDTYTDTLPVDPSHPGSYAYPSFSDTDHSEKIVDPKTGALIERMTVTSDNATMSWSAAGGVDDCSSSPIYDENHNPGALCTLVGDPTNQLYFINSATGEFRIIGSWTFLYGEVKDLSGNWTEGPCNFGFVLDDSNVGTAYCETGYKNLIKEQYVGTAQSVPFNTVLPPCNQGHTNQPCLILTDLTDSLFSGISAFDPAYNATLAPYCYIKSMALNLISFDCTQGGQDTFSWFGVYDPGQNKFIAAMNSYSDSLRWCVDHGTEIPGPVNWLLLSTNTPSRKGQPFASALTAPMSSALQTCPANSFGASGQNCTTVSVASEPCSSNSYGGLATSTECSDPNAFFLQDTKVGDIMTFNPNSSMENARLIAKNGLNWTLQWNLAGPGTKSASQQTGALLYPNCNAFNTADPLNQIGGEYWNFPNDPLGTNTNGNTLIYFDQPHTGNSHAYYYPNVFWGDKSVQLGTIPDFMTAPVININEDGDFDGQPGRPGDVADSHASLPRLNTWWLDGRPWQGMTAGPTATSLGGSLYKFTSNAYGGNGSQLNLNREIRPTLATSGNHVLLDISGPSAVLTGNSSDNYKYCIARNAGECMANSAVGDVFVNAPNILTPSCQYAGENGWNGDTFQDICINDNGTNTNNIIQQGYTVSDTTGKYSRALTNGFVQYRRTNEYWNAPSTPDGNWGFFYELSYPEYGNISGQGFLIKLPPWPTDDGIDRTTFIPTAINAVAPMGLGVTGAKVDFGYGENGNPSNYYCTTRQEACVKGNQSGNTYGYAADTITPVPCSTYCTVTIPTIPQRMTFYSIQYTNASGTVVAVAPGVSAEENTATLGAYIPTPPDVTPPVLSNISAASISQTSANIAWSTDEVADTQVYYGTTTSYGLGSMLDTTLGTQHSVNLSNLAENTSYHFKVISRDGSGNLSMSTDQTFTTLNYPASGGGGGGGETSYAPITTPTTTTLPTITPVTSTPYLTVASPVSTAMRLINDNGTFYIVQNNQLHGIASEGVLTSYGFTFDQAKPATPADLSLPKAENLLPADGSLVKSPTDPVIYLISNRQKYPFASAKVFTSLGFKFSSVLTITDNELQYLPFGSTLTNANGNHLPGLDVKLNKTIYWIGYDGQLHPYPSVPIYNSWRVAGDFSMVVPENSKDKKLPVTDPVVPRIIQ